MEVEKLVHALEETIRFLQNSFSFARPNLPVDEIVARLENKVAKARNLSPVELNLFERLFAPTALIQQISIGNGWGTKFLDLSQMIDQPTSN
jgi:hypothetical protein